MKKELPHIILSSLNVMETEMIISFEIKLNLLDGNKLLLQLNKRNNQGKKLVFPVKTKKIKNSHALMEAEIDLEKNKIFFSEIDVLDVYIIINNGKSESKYRLKSKNEPLEFKLYIYESLGKTVYPYTTNKYNLSFKTIRNGIIARVSEVHLDREGLLSFSGYVINTQQKNEINPKRYLVVTNHDSELMEEMPLRILDTKEFQKDYSLYYYSGEMFLPKYIQTDGLEFFRFYIKETYEKDTKIIEKYSPRVQVSPFEDISHEALIYIKGLKRKIIVKQTKSKKFLSTKIYVYNRRREWNSQIKIKLKKWKNKKMLKRIYKVLFKLTSMLPVKKNTVIFESFLGKQYSDNPRALYEYMKENYPNYKLYWSVDKRYLHNFEGKNVEVVKRFSIKWMFVMARANYWVSNSRLPLWIPKPRNTKYIQTWHGTPLKKLAADMDEVHMPGTDTIKYKENFLKESSKWDYLISPNSYSSEIFERAFDFRKKMIESGYPRNDVLYRDNSNEKIEELKVQFKLPSDKKIILYAPTWRDNQFYGRGKYKFNLELDLPLMREQLGDEYIVVLRMHYLVAENFDLTPYEGFAYDFSNYEDIRELYLISDFLVTDYSSVFFDYANLRKPMIFYVYDIEEYRDKLRGFYFDFEKKAPGPLVKTTKEVIGAIKVAELEGLSVDFENFYKRFCYLECGKSSERVWKEVLKGDINS
ncbi:CDP-glycerol glycerophosphotransferase family protein [Niallia alba]|uniref:CDP-glycerol glycerophosphotransferase family protein n=1 Tax=Niallia alba TaxID=2729105 RepID=UPI0039A16B7F